MGKSTAFDPGIAFSRTLGLVTREEMQKLHRSTVAIAGLGGVGGSHLMTLARLGVGGFHVADFDTFELENFNRQAGATVDTVGRPKIEVMSGLARQINPGVNIRAFPAGINSDNISEFLDGVDVYVDGLDYFVFKIRSEIFKACYDKRIPAVTAAPLGMGVALLNFLPGKMSFEQYFGWKDADSDVTKAIKFLVGLAPSLPQRRYIVDLSYVDFKRGKGPSTPMACELCAGYAGTEVLKLLLGRGKVHPAPYSLHFDAYMDKFYARKIWLGNRNPLQKLKMGIMRRLLEKQQSRNS